MSCCCFFIMLKILETKHHGSQAGCGLGSLLLLGSSSCMCVMNHNWSARKQRHHLQSVAKISHHSAMSEHRIRQCGTSSGSRCKDTDQCL